MKKRLLAVVMAAAMVIGALSACGQSKTQETDIESETAIETVADAAEEENGYSEITQIRVGYMQNYASLWEVATAINKGYFEEQGLDIKLYAFQDETAEIEAMESGSVDVIYIGAEAHKLCIKGQASIFCFSHLVKEDCEGWGCMPGYVDQNGDILVRFTKALYKAMDYGSKEENYDEVAGYVAEICDIDKDVALEQAGDDAWIDSKTLQQYLEDGTLKHYYEAQQKNFIDAGDIDKEVPVEDYVLFDIMEEAGK